MTALCRSSLPPPLSFQPRCDFAAGSCVRVTLAIRPMMCGVAAQVLLLYARSADAHTARASLVYAPARRPSVLITSGSAVWA